MTRLLLIGLLTVLSFSSYSFDEQPVKPWVEPKSEPVTTYTCYHYSIAPIDGLTISQCEDSVVKQATPSLVYENPEAPYSFSSISNIRWTPTLELVADRVTGTCFMDNGVKRCFPAAPKVVELGRARVPVNVNSKSCPPDGFPEYTVGPTPESEQNPSHEVCKPKFTPCPLGFFKNEVSTSNGQSQCVPINCPGKGTQSSSIANWNHILKVNDTGIYCDGRCAYQLDSVSYTGASFVTGTSLGLICGQGNPSDAKLTPKDSESTCTTHELSSGASFISCEGANQEPTEPDTGEGDLQPAADAAQVDPEQKPTKYQGVDCTNAANTMLCVGTDIVKALDHQTEQTKLQSDEKHNKNILFQLAINEYLERNNRERADRQSADIQNQTQQFVYGISSVTNAINQQGGSGGVGKDELDDSLDKLVETFDGDSVIAQLSSFLDEKQSQLDAANAELDSKLNEGLTKFTESDPVWAPFKQLPDILPPEYSCKPFILSLDEHPLTLDFCEYEDLIKRVIGFVFILLTGLRLFYQAQVIIRNAAIGSAQR